MSAPAKRPAPFPSPAPEARPAPARGGFKFGFASDPSSPSAPSPPAPAATEKPLPPLPGPVPMPQRFARVVVPFSAMGGLSVAVGDVVAVDWEQSEQNDLHCTLCTWGNNEWRVGTSSGFLPPSSLKLISPPADPAVAPCATDAPAAGCPVIEYDAVFDPPTAVTSFPHHISTPLDVDPSLASFAWPLSKDEFLARVQSRSCFVVHATPARLSQLSPLFNGFDVPDMLASSSRAVVWMKALRGGGMQYLDAPPTVAHSAYLAGHTLYFNPPDAVQDQLVSALAADLGYDFGAAGKDAAGGGDVEVFAVAGRHSTPWHFDAQENFSVQIRGTKRWTVRRSGLKDPLSNLHPRSTNRASVHADYKAHAYANGRGSAVAGADVDRELRPVAEMDYKGTKGGVSKEGVANKDATTAARAGAGMEVGDDDEQTVSFVVRPGSVFYHPAGLWHKVDALDDEGSLSINISLDTLRWGDFMLARLAQRLAKEPEWRARAGVPRPVPGSAAAAAAAASSTGGAGAGGAVAAVRAHVAGLITQLQKVAAELDASELVPPALLMDNRPAEPASVPLSASASSSATTAAAAGGAGGLEAAKAAAGLEGAAFALHDADAVVAAVGLQSDDKGATSKGQGSKGQTVQLRRNRLVVMINAEPSDKGAKDAAAAAVVAAESQGKKGGARVRVYEAHSGFGSTAPFHSQYMTAFYVAPERSRPLALSTPGAGTGAAGGVTVGRAQIALIDAVKNGDILPLHDDSSRTTLKDIQAWAAGWAAAVVEGKVDKKVLEEGVLAAVSVLVHVGVLVEACSASE